MLTYIIYKLLWWPWIFTRHWPPAIFRQHAHCRRSKNALGRSKLLALKRTVKII